jgi:hypothetical protein
MDDMSPTFETSQADTSMLQLPLPRKRPGITSTSETSHAFIGASVFGHVPAHHESTAACSAEVVMKRISCAQLYACSAASGERTGGI